MGTTGVTGGEEGGRVGSTDRREAHRITGAVRIAAGDEVFFRTDTEREMRMSN